MKKNSKFNIVVITTLLMIISWVIIYFTNTRDQNTNYWWQAGMAVLPILFGIFGLINSRHWSWLKSNIGQAVFFMSLGLMVWGIGQAAWTYFLFKYPNQQNPPSHILDIIDISVLPIWFYGVMKLAKATGAKYGLQKLSGKIIVVCLLVMMIAASYYFLVIVARGGTAYFSQPFWKSFFDLGYSIGDAIIFTLSLAIFGLSWKYLGGRFRWPIIMILIGFGVLYFADFSYSYTAGKGTYFNGDWPDLLFMVMVGLFGLALSLFDPTKMHPLPAQVQPTIAGIDQRPPDQPMLATDLPAMSHPNSVDTITNDNNIMPTIDNETNNQQENY